MKIQCHTILFVVCLLLMFSLYGTAQNFAPNQLLIGWKKHRTTQQKNNLKNQLEAHTLKSFENINTELLEITSNNSDIIQLIATYRQHPDIAFIEPNYKLSIDATIPNDPQFSDLWGMHNTGQSGGTADADIDAPEAWDINTDAENIVVAIIDTGIDYGHEDLVNNIWYNLGEDADGDGRVLEFINGQWVFDPGDENGIDDDGNGYIDDFVGWDFINNDNDPFDGNNHGTHCAGTVGADGNNNIGVAGVCWNVQLAALKFLSDGGWGYTSDAVEALNYAVAMNMPISNNSWGGGNFSNTLYAALQNANNNGHLFVAAAGNNYGNDNDNNPVYPASYDNENIIAVASLDRYDNLSPFSNYGATTVDLGAPGSSILSCIPGNQYASMALPWRHLM